MECRGMGMSQFFSVEGTARENKRNQFVGIFFFLIGVMGITYNFLNSVMLCREEKYRF